MPAWVFEGTDCADYADDTLLADPRDSVKYVSYMKCGQRFYKPLDAIVCDHYPPTHRLRAVMMMAGDHGVTDGHAGRWGMESGGSQRGPMAMTITGWWRWWRVVGGL